MADKSEALIARDEFNQKLEVLGLQNLDALQAQRRDVYDKYGYAHLKAQYGSFGRYDDTRRSLLAALKPGGVH